jgi:hypothetical protein
MKKSGDVERDLDEGGFDWPMTLLLCRRLVLPPIANVLMDAYEFERGGTTLS